MKTLREGGKCGFVALALTRVHPNGVKATIPQSSGKVGMSRSARSKEVGLRKNNASVSQTIEAPPRLNLLRRAAMERKGLKRYAPQTAH